MNRVVFCVLDPNRFTRKKWNTCGKIANNHTLLVDCFEFEVIVTIQFNIDIMALVAEHNKVCYHKYMTIWNNSKGICSEATHS